MPAHKGAAHHLSKLNDDLVREIRQRYDAGALLREISEWLLLTKDVNIESTYTLHCVVKRRTWRHVT